MSNINLDYGGITIDTSVFDNNGIALEGGLLKQLDQFKDGPVQVLISEIVDNEVTLHLTEKIKDARSKINQALRAAKNQLRVTEKDIINAKSLINDKGDDVDVAKARMQAFYEKTGVEIIKCDGRVDVSVLVNMYFSFIPPFENAGDKKNEFPDALALLALEAYAGEKNINILAITSDKGWARYANNSKRIDVIDNLAGAIAHFQPHNFAKRIIDSIKTDYTTGSSDKVLEAIDREIQNSLDGLDIDVEASSSFSYEMDDVYVVYKSHELDTDDYGNPEINIIRAERDLLILQMTAYVSCDVHASFGLSVWDSIDKDYIGMGSADKEIEENYTTVILIILSGDFSKGLESVDVEGIEVLETPSFVNFGEIEPDWWRDN